MQNLRTKFDIIILDTPPVGLVTDGILAMKQADLPIYIFKADYSQKDFVKNLERLIKVNKFNQITVILNAVKYNKLGYESSYGYGGYYDEAPVKKKKLAFFGSIFSIKL